eukprot:907174-Pyramimonas_sp.AAC.2
MKFGRHQVARGKRSSAGSNVKTGKYPRTRPRTRCHVTTCVTMHNRPSNVCANRRCATQQNSQHRQSFRDSETRWPSDRSIREGAETRSIDK